MYFLATWASQYWYQQITGNFPSKTFFTTKIHGESPSHINMHTGNVPHDSVFSHEFSCKRVASETT